MALFRKGNMLNHLDECDYACITTNSFIKKDGRLVMGAGIAKQVRDSVKDIDKRFGDGIFHLTEYNLVKAGKFYAFQVKYHFKDNADLDLIERTTHKLKVGCEKRPDLKVFLNFPGIGNGHLSREQVLPIVEQLPDNVTIWEYK